MSEEICGAIGVLEAEGGVYLVANHRRLQGETRLCWDLPGGAVEGSESLEEAIVREMAEETGWPVRVTDLLFMVERFGFRDDPSGKRSRFFFLGLEAVGEQRAPSDPKIVDHGFCPLGELRERCREFYHREMHEWFEGGRRQSYFVTRFQA